MNIINTADCVNCVYCTVEEVDKAHIYVHCDKREKKYFWGQTVPCEDKEEVKE